MKPETMMIDDVKYIREDSIKPQIQSTQDHPYQLNKNYFIRTVTMAHAGKLVAVTDKELVLETVVWVADSGRFMSALRSGNFSEVEPFPEGEQVIVGRGAIIDAVVIKSFECKQK